MSENPEQNAQPATAPETAAHAPTAPLSGEDAQPAIASHAADEVAADEADDDDDDTERDIEKGYSVKSFVAKLRRLANALEQQKPFTIQVAGERITVPADAVISVEHERSSTDEELEFQLKWQRS